MKPLVTLFVILALAGCGGTRMPSKSQGLRPAEGPISRACMASDRKARSPALCGCIQAAANLTLSGGDQSRAAGFYDDPQQAQDIRQSDRYGDSQFWKRYRSYAETAEAYCRV